MEKIKEHQESLDVTNPRDYIDYYLIKQKQVKFLFIFYFLFLFFLKLKWMLLLLD